MNKAIEAIFEIASNFFRIGEKQLLNEMKEREREVDEHARTGLGAGGASFRVPTATTE